MLVCMEICKEMRYNFDVGSVQQTKNKAKRYSSLNRQSEIPIDLDNGLTHRNCVWRRQPQPTRGAEIEAFLCKINKKV